MIGRPLIRWFDAVLFTHGDGIPYAWPDAQSEEDPYREIVSFAIPLIAMIL